MTVSLPRFAFVAALVLALACSPQAAAGGGKTVVELFTSQGCSSCPPADELMGELVKRNDLVALSLPVDYWDFLGWKDTMASPANSDRQRAYARERGDAKVYTPQMVINGITHVVGSQRHAVEAKIRKAAANDRREVDVSIGETGDAIVVDIAGAGLSKADSDAATVWFVLYSPEATVKIGRGENSGRTVTYYNVVRLMMPIGMWHGTPASFELPKNDLAGTEDLGCAVLVQLHGTGPVIGASAINSVAIAGR